MRGSGQWCGVPKAAGYAVLCEGRGKYLFLMAIWIFFKRGLTLREKGVY